MIENEQGPVADFLTKAISEMAPPRTPRVVDFGCGEGRLVGELLDRGLDAHGCDLGQFWDVSSPNAGRLASIQLDPYRLPYEDMSADVIVSTSVLEHVRNKEVVFREFFRILKPGGCAMHLFPAKNYLPVEPHIYVPLVNVMWPRCPRAWLAMWAWLGIRNEFQAGWPWRTVVAANVAFCETGIDYWSSRRLRRQSLAVFGNYDEPMRFFIDHGYGGFVRIARRMPRWTRGLSAWLGGRFRIVFVAQRRPLQS